MCFTFYLQKKKTKLFHTYLNIDVSLCLGRTCYPINNQKIRLIQQHIVIGYLWCTQNTLLEESMRDSREFPPSRPLILLCICVASHHHKFPSSHVTRLLCMCWLVSGDVSQEIEWKGKRGTYNKKRKKKIGVLVGFFFVLCLVLSFSYFVLL